MFAKLPPFVIAQVFDFLQGVEIAATLTRTCKKFQTTCNMDLIWRNQCTRSFTFVNRRTELKETWKSCYRRKIKGTKNIKEGVSHESYVMTPLRAHKAFITAIASLGDIVISGDDSGSLRAWLLDPTDYEDGEPDTVELYTFKKWERQDEDGQEIKFDKTRVTRVWLLEGRDQYGDLVENLFTIVAMSINQAAILTVEIEGYAPPKIKESDQYLKHLIRIKDLDTIAQTEILSISRKGVSSVSHSSLLMIAPNLGYALPQEQGVETIISFYDVTTGECVQKKDLGEAAGILHQKNHPAALGDNSALRCCQILKRKNQNELIFAITTGVISKLSLNNFKIAHGQSTQLLNKDTVVLQMGQDPAGQFLYIVVDDQTLGQTSLLILSAETLKTLSQQVLQEQFPYSGIEVAHYEISDIESMQYSLSQLQTHQGYLVLLVCGQSYFKALLHVATEKIEKKEEDKEQVKEKSKIEYQHTLKGIGRKEKLNIFDENEMRKLGALYDFAFYRGKNVVTAFSADIANVNDLRSGKILYSLRGGSRMVHPKSYVKNPERDGFAYMCISEAKVVAARGNLVRVYNFDIE